MSLKEDYRKDRKKDVYNNDSAASFADDYVYWLESKLERIAESLPPGSEDVEGVKESKVVKALRNLVHLKEWKDKHGKDHHYEQFQPEAWVFAKEALSELI